MPLLDANESHVLTARVSRYVGAVGSPPAPPRPSADIADCPSAVIAARVVRSSADPVARTAARGPGRRSGAPRRSPSDPGA